VVGGGGGGGGFGGDGGGLGALALERGSGGEGGQPALPVLDDRGVAHHPSRVRPCIEIDLKHRGHKVVQQRRVLWR